MTVSKEELFAKYKQLKAEGMTITLMELKKQMEAEADQNSPAQTPPQSGFSALNQPPNEQPTQILSTQTPLPTNQPSVEPAHAQSSWTTSYYTQQPATPTQTAEPTTQPQLWQPTQPVVPTTEPTEPVSPQVFPQVEEQIKNTYASNFSGNFAFGANSQVNASIIMPAISQPQAPSETPQLQQDKNQNKFCLIGYPLGHSLSTYIHEAGFKSLNLNCTYELLETPPEALVDRIKYLKTNNFAGFNVTIPLKLPVVLFLDELDSSADLIGAINTVVINPDKTMKGYNTDVLGFRRAIPQEITLAGKTVAILGTGGAARAAITALAQEQVKSIKIYTRNIPNTLELLKYLREKFPIIEFNAFQIERLRDLSDIDILVNTTPLGMLGRAADLTPVEENELITLPKHALVYDVIYNPRKTILLKLAEKHGYRTINGLDMLVHQAVAAEEIWFGQTPDFKDMKIAALENI